MDSPPPENDELIIYDELIISPHLAKLLTLAKTQFKVEDILSQLRMHTLYSYYIGMV